MAKKDYRKIRASLGMNQSEFWNRIGITQSGGSRYEGGRKLPAPAQTCFDIAYGTPEERETAIACLSGKAAASARKPQRAAAAKKSAKKKP